MESTPMKKLLIIYHHPCFDGAFGAVTVYKYYKCFLEDRYDISFLPLTAGEAFKQGEVSHYYDKIIIIDVSITKEGYDEMMLYAIKSIVIFDHHATGINDFKAQFKEMLEMNGYSANGNKDKRIKTMFDEENKQSGCGLVFRYYKEKAIRKGYDKEKVKELFNDEWDIVNQYVEDADIGRFTMKNTEDFKSGLCTEFHNKYYAFDFRIANNARYYINKIYTLNFKFTMSSGEKSYRNYKSKAKTELMRGNTFWITLKHSEEESWTFLIHITEKKQYRNYTGPLLAQLSQMNGHSPIGGYLYSSNHGLYKLSLRNASNGIIDLAYLAKLFNGGGHANAAAFTNSFDFFKSKIVKPYKIANDILNVIG